MTTSTTLAQRLKSSRTNAGLLQSQVAELVGIKQPTYQALESGKTAKSAYLAQIAKVLNVDPYWLSTGQSTTEIDAQLNQILEKSSNPVLNSENNNEGRFWVDLVNIKFSCGDGESIEFHFDEVIKRYPFDESFFKHHGVKPENMVLALATGDSQEPYVCANDMFGIDLTDTEIKDGHFYAVYFEGEAMLKQIFKEEGGVLILHSLNPKYRDKSVSEVNGSSFRVIGRQFFRAG
ncbi:XRE family transcriptional regulator [Acinetobacter chinensis]|uniref:XRE family transcriptional regulator n=1 Tax=Acinetobacter chinensis TaxID=2004650 RepID=UPI002934F9C7|nr:S24 family peptidase [Acinetobacter chinensis]WOE40100.1 S24 family peptidase [Acinetobacter chinensis]